jgi:hypothetical protein
MKPGRIDVVVSDVVIPRVGVATRFLFTSARIGVDELAAVRSRPGTTFLAKPWTISEARSGDPEVAGAEGPRGSARGTTARSVSQTVCGGTVRRSLAVTTLLSVVLPCAVLGTQTPAPLPPSHPDVAAWRADLHVLATQLPERHPAPFTKITRAEWDSAVARLDRRLPVLSRDQILVELFRLVASMGDAHTSIQPNPSLSLRYYALELYSFEDGLFVRKADSVHANWVGARVLRIGRVSADEALATAGAIIPHENEWWVRAWAPFWLMIPEMVHGLGIASDPEHLLLVLERGGRSDSLVITPAGRLRDGHGGGPIDEGGWITMRRTAAPLWEQRPDQLFWWTYLPASRWVYVCSRAVVPVPGAATNRAQWDSIFALADSTPAARLVLDIRENQGGNGFLNRYPIQQILRRPSLDRPDRLFMIIGRRTFSAGQQFANLFEAWTHGTLVGEPTGQQPSQYGDHKPLELPHSRLIVNISTIFHQAPNEFDRRSFVPPATYTPLASDDYARGVDPALAAALATDSIPPPVSLVERAALAEDAVGSETALRAAQGMVANRFRSFESEVNALGYRLLGAGKVEAAILAFQVNTRVYPHSANTYDSLGEALVVAGRRAEAVAAYRKALEIDPSFESSVEALRRLGAAPVRPPQ